MFRDWYWNEHLPAHRAYLTYINMQSRKHSESTLTQALDLYLQDCRHCTGPCLADWIIVWTSRCTDVPDKVLSECIFSQQNTLLISRCESATPYPPFKLLLDHFLPFFIPTCCYLTTLSFVTPAFFFSVLSFFVSLS